MQTLHKFSGILNQGFVGNICYNFALAIPYKALKIRLNYDKLLFNEASLSARAAIEKAYLDHYNQPLKEANTSAILSSMKTEIQLAAYIGNTFIGNIHNPATCKEISISQAAASNGCFPLETDSIIGTLKVVVNVFSVLEDETTYTLTIEGEPYEAL